MEVRYIVGHGWADTVGETTALPHRVLTIDYAGDITIRRHHPAVPEAAKLLLQMSAAELTFIARQARRGARRRFWTRIFGRR